MQERLITALLDNSAPNKAGLFFFCVLLSSSSRIYF